MNLPKERRIDLSETFYKSNTDLSVQSKLRSLQQERELQNSISIIQKNNYNILYNREKRQEIAQGTNWKHLLTNIKRERKKETQIENCPGQFIKKRLDHLGERNRENENRIKDGNMSRIEGLFKKLKLESISKSQWDTQFKFLS